MTTKYPSEPGFRTVLTETSAQAAKSVKNPAETIREECIAALTAASLTAHEVAAKIRPEGMGDVAFVRYQHSVQSRISELHAAEKVIPTPLRRKNPETGKFAVVWAKAGKLIQPDLI